MSTRTQTTLIAGDPWRMENGVKIFFGVVMIAYIELDRTTREEDIRLSEPRDAAAPSVAVSVMRTTVLVYPAS